MNIDPDQVFHQEAIEKARNLVSLEQHWLKALKGEQELGFDRAVEIEQQKLVVKSLKEMADYAAERRMRMTTRWIVNSAIPAEVDRERYTWAGLPFDQARVVQAAIQRGTTVRYETFTTRHDVAQSVHLIQFNDPELGERWAVTTKLWDNQRTVTDHPTLFDAETRYEELTRVARTL